MLLSLRVVNPTAFFDTVIRLDDADRSEADRQRLREAVSHVRLELAAEPGVFRVVVPPEAVEILRQIVQPAAAAPPVPPPAPTADAPTGKPPRARK